MEVFRRPLVQQHRALSVLMPAGICVRRHIRSTQFLQQIVMDTMSFFLLQ